MTKLGSKSNNTSSRHVRKLAHRPPVPRGFHGRLVHLIGHFRRFPLATILVILIALAMIPFYRYVVHSEYFSLEEIALSGNQRLSDQYILTVLKERCDIDKGSSTVRIDERAIQKEIASIPEVQLVTVKKEWPNSLHISIDEHDPTGILVTESGSLVYSKTGYLFGNATGDDFTLRNIPIITGFDDHRFERGGQLPLNTFNLITDYTKVFPAASPDLANMISEYHWDKVDGLVLVMDDGARFLCGTRPPEETGPIVETFLRQPSPGHRIVTANLYSDLYVTITRRPDSTMWSSDVANHSQEIR